MLSSMIALLCSAASPCKITHNCGIFSPQLLQTLPQQLHHNYNLSCSSTHLVKMHYLDCFIGPGRRTHNCSAWVLSSWSIQLFYKHVFPKSSPPPTHTHILRQGVLKTKRRKIINFGQKWYYFMVMSNHDMLRKVSKICVQLFIDFLLKI